MKSIKHISQTNWAAIPEIIKDIYFAMSIYHRHGDHSDRQLPFTEFYSIGEYGFYYDHYSLRYLMQKVKAGDLYNEEFEVIKKGDLKQYWQEYAKGFASGYFDYESRLQSGSSAFKGEEKKVQAIFSRVCSPGIGGPKLGGVAFSLKRISEAKGRAKIKEGKNFVNCITYQNFFKAGFEGGEFYKAWEIVLEHPMLFTQHFEMFRNAQNKSGVSRSNSKVEKNPYPETFKEGAYQLFDYLMTEIATFKTKSKISLLYHYFKKKELFAPNLTQSKYLQFSAKYGEPPSKIFQQTDKFKFKDYINETLPDLIKNFKAQKQTETN